MRKQIWIIGAIFLAVCCTFFLWHHARESKKAEQVESEKGTETNQANSISQSEEAPPGQQNTSPTVSPKVPMEMRARRVTAEESNAANQKIVALWRAPIEFYGKVVDEKSNAVVGAKVTFSWMESPEENGAKSLSVESDTDGLFSLHDAHGPSLRVSVNKDGYYSSREAGHPTFKYGAFGVGDFSPDPQNPIVFHLRKKNPGQPLIQSHFPPGAGQFEQLRHDGTPVEIDLLSGQKAAPGAGQLKLELWRAVSEKNAPTFDWKAHISVPGGGLVKMDDEFAFEAPEEGYQPSFVVDMPATNQNWREDFTSKFYVHLPDGKFGRVDFNLSGYNGVFAVNCAINPTGSRNLEPAEVKPQAPPVPSWAPPGSRAVIPEFK